MELTVLIWTQIVTLRGRLFPCYRTKFESTLLCAVKPNLLLPHCGDSKYSIYCRASSKKNGQLMLKRPKFPEGFQERVVKGSVRRGFRACDQLVCNSQVGWHQGEILVSSIFWFQPVWSLCACGQQFSSGSASCKTT